MAQFFSADSDLQTSDHFRPSLLDSPVSYDDDGIVIGMESRGKICRHTHDCDCGFCKPVDSDDPREFDETEGGRRQELRLRQVGAAVKDLDRIGLE